MPTPLPQGFPEPTPAGIIELKHYPQYRAVTYLHQGDLQIANRVAFNPLFEHISSNQIAMTTPVEARYTVISETPNAAENQAEVSFLYGNPTINPDRIGPSLQVTTREPMAVVSIGIQGPYTWESYESNLKKLKDWLVEHPKYQMVGTPRRLFYHGPMTPEALKISEVQIPISLS